MLLPKIGSRCNAMTRIGLTCGNDSFNIIQTTEYLERPIQNWAVTWLPGSLPQNSPGTADPAFGRAGVILTLHIRDWLQVTKRNTLTEN